MNRGLHTRGPAASINVTPLIDVMLVLLILFMVATPMATRSLDARLPHAPAPVPSVSPQPALLLEIEDGGLKLNGTYLGSHDALGLRLRDLIAVRSDKTLLVRASGTLPYGRVATALDVARWAGVERIGLLGLGDRRDEQTTRP